MEAKERKVLVPEYMLRFQCIGPECEDTCCSGWQVNVDRDTYEIYKQLKDPDLQQMFDHHVVKKETAASEQDYAYIKFNEQGRCLAMTDEGWCSIHMKYGQQALGMTCANYPRSFNLVDGVVEKSGNTSCPEIARLALLDPEGIAFTETSEDFPYSFGVLNKLENDGDPLKAENYFWDLRVFSITVLQNRKLLLTDRLLLLGLFCQKLNELFAVGQVQQIPALISTYVQMMETDDLHRRFAQLPSLAETQVLVFKMLLDMWMQKFAANERLNRMFVEFFSGLQIRPDSPIEEIVEKYRTANQQYNRELDAKYEYIFENYLVNHVFRTGFPFYRYYRNHNVFAEFIILAVHFSLLRFVTVGLAAHHGEQFDEHKLVSWIQMFSKYIDHSNVFVNQILESIYKHQLHTMAYMTVLLKN